MDVKKRNPNPQLLEMTTDSVYIINNMKKSLNMSFRMTPNSTSWLLPQRHHNFIVNKNVGSYVYCSSINNNQEL